ncbi:MAG: 30S ribosomal protein S2 [Candidatus Pacebacteria bacterium]|nr:30S ribosomal protein S2 [Candidatus Paceibacterota bacterium]
MTEEKQPSIQEVEMEKAGLHYGHKKTRNHPKAAYFTLKSSTELSFINLDETAKALEAALNFIKEIIEKGDTILFVGTIPGAKNGIEKLAKKYDFPYVTNRWLGGTLTNFKTFNERIKYLKELEEKKKSGEWQKYTKHERRELEEEMAKLEEQFVGLKDTSKLPDVLFIVDPKIHDTAAKEARIIKIPIVAILDTDDDPTSINYPIPANDSAKSSIDYILDQVDQAIKQVKKIKN